MSNYFYLLLISIPLPSHLQKRNKLLPNNSNEHIGFYITHTYLRGLEIFSCIILIVDNDDSIQRSLYTRKQVFIKQTPGMKGRICTGNYLVGLKVNVKKEGQQFYV